MLYALLPFLLAFNVPENDVAWKFGPEYTFSGHVKMIAALDRDAGLLMGNNLIFKLKCRPVLNNRLSCHFEDTKIAKITPNAFNVSAGEKSEEYKIAGVMNEKFEIDFNEKGIDSYLIGNSLPAFGLDMTRLICNQLSIGAKIAVNGQEFRALEKFTNGEYQVNFTAKKFSRQPITKDHSKFDLRSLQDDLQISDELIRIEKKRDVHDCRASSGYFFGSRYIYGIVYRDVTTKLKSSNSTINVSRDKFTSETVNLVELFDENNKREGDVLDHMMLSLESVLPAKTELLALKNSVRVGIIANAPEEPYLE